ncbi:hypothetical protein [Haloquadratum walsbyi]|mgnify:FL=1|jgi:hypothetical protein|uniref:hypothetical protein n=1 Tax=Haloquadratum walsbyi TaxID=293091 RepID=UPI0023F0CA26|nr:hypothetical protein [Haloquadratum walsbyi]
MDLDIWPDGWGLIHRGVFLIIDGVGLMLTVALFDIYRQPAYWNIERSTISELITRFIEYATSSVSVSTLTPESALISVGAGLIAIGVIRYLLLTLLRWAYNSALESNQFQREL